MDFGLKIGFSLKDKLGSHTEQTANYLLERIDATVLQYCIDRDLSYVQTVSYGEYFLVNVYPEEKEVEFYITEDQYLVCYASSSAAGPGFHGFVVNMLKHVAETCKLEWQWDGTDQNFYCDGSFHNDQNFTKLQDDMCLILVTSAQNIISENLIDIRLGMPADCAVVHDHFAVSPMGFWARDFFIQLAENDTSQEEKRRLAYSFYPWWDEGGTADFWYNMGVCMMNVSVPWHPIRDKLDQGFLYCVLALRAFEVARQLAPERPFPEDEITELHNLLYSYAANKDDVYPEVEGLGFRRKSILHHLPNQWCIRVPGFFYNVIDDTPQKNDDEGTPLIFYYDDIHIQCRIYNIGVKDDEDISDYVYYDSDHTLLDTYNEDGFASFITKHDIITKDGDQYTILEGEFGYQSTAMIVSIMVPLDDDYDWLVNLLQNTYHTDFFSEEYQKLSADAQNAQAD